jgi:hypothetical protein
LRKAFEDATAKNDFEGCYEVYKEKNIYNFYMLVDEINGTTGSASGTRELCPHEAAGRDQQPAFPRQGLRP